jgi:aminoglycoside 6'-N-acetyltransferase I
LKSRYGLEIRAADVADAQGLCELLRIPGLAAGSVADRLLAMKQQAGAVLIAADWGPPAGVVIVHWYRTVVIEQPVAQITTLLVADDERRRGIGRLLVKAAAQAARSAGCGRLELLAAPEQQGLAAFCAASGFELVGERFIRPLRKRV